MSSRKSSSTKKKKHQNGVEPLKSAPDRESKIMNSIANVSIILMSIMMGAFSELMVKTTGAMASGMANAIGGEEAAVQVENEVTQKLPEVNDKMKALVSNIRKDMYAQLKQKRKDIEPLLSDKVFDIGPQTIEEYDFGLTKITEELDENTLSRYTQLMACEDPKFGKMFKALTEWMNSLPKEPTRQKNK